jgi:hypothetical protein
VSDRFEIEVPMRTSQTFLVYADSAAAAKREVEAWFVGERDEGDDLTILDDVGMTSYRTRPRRWIAKRIDA